MATPLPYPPPWQDAPTLCGHLCISDSTLENWERQGIIPPHKQRGGKRMWEWAEVERYMRGDAGIVPGDEASTAKRVYDATRKAVNAR